MPLLRRHRRFITWLALGVLVLAALAPAVSRALASAQGDAWALAQVCSADAGQRGGADGGTPGGTAHAFEHCPFCALHSDGWGLPPALPAQAEAPALRHALPALFLQAPRPLFAWAAALARAPPVLA